MSTVSSLGPSFLPPSTLAGSLPSRLQSPDQHRPARLANGSAAPVSLSADGLNLAMQDNPLADRVNELGAASADFAQKFLMDFARQTLGDAADGMQVSFDFASVSARSSASAMVQHTEDASGTSDLAALSLQDAADFIGRGTITTADGHRYTFEVEVHYQASLEASAASTSTAGPRATEQPGRHLPPPNHPERGQDLDLHFPGKLKDLFNLLSQGALSLPFQMVSGDAGKEDSKSGLLTLRLLDMLEHPNPLLQQLSKAYDQTPAAPEISAQA